MKIILTLAFLMANSYALEVSFIGPCSETPLHQSNKALDLKKSVGHYTIEVLQKNNIDYIGNEQGLNSVFNTPIGDEALEVLSDTEMRAYGWCYQVGGFEPGSYPHEYFVSSNNDHIVWFFGFAHYKDGEWVSQCEPAHTVKPDFLCL